MVFKNSLEASNSYIKMVDTLPVTVDLKLNLNTKGNFFKLAGEKKNHPSRYELHKFCLY